MNYYLVLALVGTVLFTFKVISMLAGHHVNLSDAEDVGHVDIDHHDDGDDADGEFKIWSYQSVLAFLMVFGWSGLAFTNDMGVDNNTAMLLATLSGTGGALISAGSMYLLNKLNSSSVFLLPKVGEVCKVYQRIPAKGDGIGKILSNVNGRVEEFSAVSETSAIESGSYVTVVQSDQNPLIVKPINQ